MLVTVGRQSFVSQLVPLTTERKRRTHRCVGLQLRCVCVCGGGGVGCQRFSSMNGMISKAVGQLKVVVKRLCVCGYVCVCVYV